MSVPLTSGPSHLGTEPRYVTIHRSSPNIKSTRLVQEGSDLRLRWTAQGPSMIDEVCKDHGARDGPFLLSVDRTYTDLRRRPSQK